MIKSSWLNGNFPKIGIWMQHLNTKYNVGGSPTLIINGVESNAGRDSASFLSGYMCSIQQRTIRRVRHSLAVHNQRPGLLVMIV